jgi:hypothetical protein
MQAMSIADLRRLVERPSAPGFPAQEGFGDWAKVGFTSTLALAIHPETETVYGVNVVLGFGILKKFTLPHNGNPDYPVMRVDAVIKQDFVPHGNNYPGTSLVFVPWWVTP